MHKKIISTLVAGCLVTGLVLNQPVWAEEAKIKVMPKPPGEMEGDPTLAKFPLDKAIARAKEVFAISNEYETFQSGFNSYNGRAEWHLNWLRETEPRGNISVRLDATTGEIIGMDRWQDIPPGRHYSGLPQYSWEEGAQRARQWVQKLMPDYVSQIRLLPNQDQPYYGYGERGPVEYSYNFVRVVKGIPFPEHNIYVRLNGDTGELLGINLNWDNRLTFPDATRKISSDQAARVVGENVELAYFRPPGPANTPVKLVYRVNKGQGLLIDALTGKVLESPGNYYERGGMGGDMAAEKNAKQELTPAEQAEVAKLKNLLSADKALAQAKKVINIPFDLNQVEKRLSYDYQYPDQKQWNFYWSNRDDASYQSINIAVDAVTGELVGFNKWQQIDEAAAGQQPRLTREQAQRTAEDFIKKIQSRRLAESKLEQSWSDAYGVKGMPGIYRFVYVRLVNNIPFANNGFEVEVNAYTGEVTSFRMAWWPLQFPQPSVILEKPKAVNIFLADDGLALEYARIFRDKSDPPVNLVYRLKDRPSYMIDAQTGRYLNWQGEPIPPKPNYNFTDIAGHPAENDIKQLAKANIVKSVDDKFYPQRNLTKLAALEMLVASRGWYTEPPYQLLKGSEQEKQQQQVVNAALNLGIITAAETGELNRELTRLEWARLMINTLDYDGVAKLSEIYTLNTKDANQVPRELQGFAALSLGLGLQSVNQGYYRPHEKVTRGLAAMSLVRMLKVQK
ncbi:hypothetical protein JCM39194_16220 [Desulfotomaculum varum]